MSSPSFPHPQLQFARKGLTTISAEEQVAGMDGALSPYLEYFFFFKQLTT